ncbi:LysR family transcriptional regulator [Ochrobactrum vermis]|uniref:LysR family transcriptional regulator n=1 Tax=Ochrobactrum vermis TaxID=1827297 RepID=A0ABU8PFI8_9HYPH|nr:LysR family transcriptional regulator [Ochrobactrum vermis]
MFDIVLLRTFEAVAGVSSFTRAGQQLNLTQSAVSAHIRRLEEQAGSVLFERNTRTVALTPQGQALLGYAKAILRLSEEARILMKGSTNAFHLRIGASDDLTSTWLPSVLKRFQNSRSERTLEIQISNTASLLETMEKGELDLAIGCRCRGDQSGTHLWSEPLKWAVGKTLVEAGTLIPLAVFPEPCPYRDAALAGLAAKNSKWRIASISPSLGSLTALVAAGLAVTPLNSSSIPAKLQTADANELLPLLPDVEFVAHIRPGLSEENMLLTRSVIDWITANRPKLNT